MSACPLAMPVFARGGLRARQRVLGIRTMIQEIDGDGCAFLREADGDRPPDSLQGSGHERVLRGEAGRNARHTIRRLHGRRHK